MFGRNLNSRTAEAGQGLFWKHFDGSTNSLKEFYLAVRPKDFGSKYLIYGKE